MNNRFLLVSLVLFVFSCEQKPALKDSVSIPDIDAFKSYKVDIKAPKTRITDLISSVEIARLEETSESYLKNIQQIFEYQDKLVFYNQGTSNIYVFDQAGNFINRINRAGIGPEEYGQISDLWLENDTIAVHFRGNQTVKKYDFQGNFITSHRLPARIDHIYGYGSGYVFGTNFIPMYDSIRYLWGIWDKDLSLSKGFLPYEPSSDNKLFMLYNTTIHPYQDDRLLLRMHGDSVYLLRDNQLKPLVHFDYEEDWFWTGRGPADGKNMDAIDNSGQVWENTINVGQQHIYLKSIVAYDGWEHFLINRLTGEVKHLDIKRTPEELFTLTPLLWQEGRLLCSIPSTEVAEFINQLGPEHVQFKEGTSLDIIESSENPVLMWIKFKTDSK